MHNKRIYYQEKHLFYEQFFSICIPGCHFARFLSPQRRVFQRHQVGYPIEKGVIWFTTLKISSHCINIHIKLRPIFWFLQKKNSTSLHEIINSNQRWIKRIFLTARTRSRSVTDISSTLSDYFKSYCGHNIKQKRNASETCQTKGDLCDYTRLE